MILRGNALMLPLADDTVDLVVTSPPYFGLRSYQDGCADCADDSKAHMRGYMERYCPGCGKVGTVQKCPKCDLTTLRTEATKAAIRKSGPKADCATCGGTGKGHYAGQIGDEPTPAEFVDALVAATAEMVRVVKPSGSIFVNLGDKYNGAARGTIAHSESVSERSGTRTPGYRLGAGRLTTTSVSAKSLLLIPQRYAIRCVDELGLILRAEIIWSKPNGLPESVTDRVRRSHESWFHFTLSPRYYSAVDEIREPHGAVSLRRAMPNRANVRAHEDRHEVDMTQACHPLGKLPGSVWTIGDGQTTLGVVLEAVAGGHLTPEEGERILWAGRNGSGPRSTSPATAGNGSAGSTATAMDATGTPSRETAERTDSPTNSSRGPSPMGSPSTTSAGTSGASTQTTSRPSQPESTSFEETHQPLATQPSGSAGQDIRSTSETPTSGPMAGESAAPACETECEPDAPPSVWVIATEPLHVPDHLGVDHFAAYPTEWPRRIIQGWSPSGICTACGEGRMPVAQVIGGDRARTDLGGAGRHDHMPSGRGIQNRSEWVEGVRRTITGEACACPEPTAPTRPATILDPFGGTGTTALVAHALGRHAVHVDMSADYCRLAQWRTSDPKQRAKAARREYTPPPEQTTGQLDLLEGLGA